MDPATAILSGQPFMGGWLPEVEQPVSTDPWSAAIATILAYDEKVVALERVPGVLGEAERRWVEAWDLEAPESRLGRALPRRVLRAAAAHSATGGALTEVPPVVAASVAFDSWSLREFGLTQHLSYLGVEALAVCLPVPWAYYLHATAGYADLFTGEPQRSVNHVEAAEGTLLKALSSGRPEARWVDPLTCSLANRCLRLIRMQLLAGKVTVPGSIEVCSRLLEQQLDLPSDRAGAVQAEQGRALTFLWDRDHRQRQTVRSDVEAFLEVLAVVDEDWPDEETLGASLIALADLGALLPAVATETNLLIHALHVTPPTESTFSTPASADLLASVLLDHLGETWVNDWGRHLIERYGPTSPDLDTIDKFIKLTT